MTPAAAALVRRVAEIRAKQPDRLRPRPAQLTLPGVR